MAVLLSPCSMCHTKRPVVEEPLPSRFMILSDYPGVNEAKRGRNFCGRSGAELDRLYLPKAGLSRNDIYTSNVIKCLWSKNTSPDPEQVHTCAHHWLPWEIRRVQPEVIIVAGSQAIKLFRGKSVTMDHGLPFRARLTREFGGQHETYWQGWVYPTFNPAAGLRDAVYMDGLLSDFENLPKFLRNPEAFFDNLPQDPYPCPDYRRLEGARDVSRHLGSFRCREAVWGRPGMGMDTETVPSPTPGAPDPPFCLSYSLDPGTGGVIMADDYGGLEELYCWMATFNPVVFIHNGLFDLPVLDHLELPQDLLDNVSNPRRWRDTMIRAYHQRDLPIALKVLARRELGATMQTFDDLVLPFTVTLVRKWLDKITTHPGGWKHVRKPRQVALDKRTARISGDMKTWLDHVANEELLDAGIVDDSETEQNEDDGKFSNPWSRWKKLPPEMREAAKAAYGSMPVKSIAHVPPLLADYYAARDSDMALRLGLGLLEKRMYNTPAKIAKPGFVEVAQY